MYILLVGWGYVALMMAVAEATNPRGSVLGAIFTFFLYGVMPIGIAMYILGTPGRKRRLRDRKAAQASAPPDGGREPAGDAVAPVRKED